LVALLAPQGLQAFLAAQGLAAFFAAHGLQAFCVVRDFAVAEQGATAAWFWAVVLQALNSVMPVNAAVVSATDRMPAEVA
jgi:hypothetical protein